MEHVTAVMHPSTPLAPPVLPTRADLRQASAREDTSQRANGDTLQDMLGAALVLEKLLAAVYYAGLTTPAVVRTRPLAGRSSDPNDPGLPPNGHPQQVRYLQAALDAEMKHAAFLVAAGARGDTRRLYVPAGSLARLGTSTELDSFLGLLNHLETMAVGLYIAAMAQFLRLGRSDLALLAAQIAGIESEHRMLGRAIAGLRPANNLTLAPAPFDTVAEAARGIQPFVTGHGVSHPVRAIAVPTAIQAARVSGKYTTRLVRTFL